MEKHLLNFSTRSSAGPARSSADVARLKLARSKIDPYDSETGLCANSNIRMLATPVDGGNAISNAIPF